MKKRIHALVQGLGLSLLLVMIGPISAFAQTPSDSGVITFAELGKEEILLNGPYDSTTITFGLPANWNLLSGAQLNLNALAGLNSILPDSSSLNVFGGTLRVKFNRDTIAIVPINSIGELSYNIPIPAYDLASVRSDGRMELRFELDSGISCHIDQNMNLVIRPDSTILLPYEEKTVSTDLIDFPYPIYQSTIFPDKALIVLPDDASSGEVNGAVTVSAGLGNLTSSKLNLDLTSVSQLTAEQKEINHLILVGKASSLPVLGDLTLPLPTENGKFALLDSEDDGVVQMVNSPWSPNFVILVVSGNTDAGVLKAAQAVSTGILQANTQPNLAIVEDVQDEIPTTVVSDATLSDLGYDQVILDERGVDSTVFNFYLHPGHALDNDAYFELHYGHSALLDFKVSGLVVLLNDQPIGSGRFTTETADQAIVQSRFAIPAVAALPGVNRLEIRSSLELLDHCTDPSLMGLWMVIWPESYLHLPSTPVQVNASSVLDLSMYPAPMVFEPDLSTTAFVLQKNDPNYWKAASKIAGFLGDNSNGPISLPWLVFDDEVPDVDLSGYNLIVIGRPSQLSIMEELNQIIPVPFEEGTDYPIENYTQVVYRTPADVPLGYVELGPSPWNQDFVVIAALGNTTQGVDWATSALYDEILQGQLAGNFAVINDTQVQTADTRLGQPVEELLSATSEPNDTEPVQINTATQTTDRPIWILIAMVIIGVLIVLVIAYLLWISWRRSRS